MWPHCILYLNRHEFSIKYIGYCHLQNSNQTNNYLKSRLLQGDKKLGGYFSVLNFKFLMINLNVYYEVVIQGDATLLQHFFFLNFR